MHEDPDLAAPTLLGNDATVGPGGSLAYPLLFLSGLVVALLWLGHAPSISLAIGPRQVLGRILILKIYLFVLGKII